MATEITLDKPENQKQGIEISIEGPAEPKLGEELEIQSAEDFQKNNDEIVIDKIESDEISGTNVSFDTPTEDPK